MRSLPLPLAALVAAAFSPLALADDWPQWLGPQRDGVYRESGVATDFSKSPPKELWRVPVGGGYAGPAVAGGRVFVPDFVLNDAGAFPENQFSNPDLPGRERVLCLDAATGETVWEYAPQVTYRIQYPAGPRVTPTVELEGDGPAGRVYFLGGMGDLVCLDAATGKKAWGYNVTEKYGAQQPIWGFASHPLVDGENLYVIAGPADGPLLCVNKATGELKWKACTAEDECGYAPPVMYERAGKKMLLAWTAESVNAVDPATGKVHWSVPAAVSFNMSIAHPIPATVDGAHYLYCMSHDPTAVVMLKLADDPTAKPEVLWRGDQRTGMNGVMNTPVFDASAGEEGLLFSPDRNGVFVAADPLTGEQVAEDRQFFGSATTWGTIFTTPLGDTGAVLFAVETGELQSGSLSDEGAEVNGSAKVLEPTQIAGNRRVLWVHPAYAMKSAFWRNDKELVRVDLAE
ncbi:outer membrane protein assembly factor BamB family protein [Alienimonas californiensis]|uniref:Outer membrane biogenesis protein BamB n=1 Tax=Alienimonas californiensis TaxID=2527989 RepID=A0A517P5C2_9PLAN|nr:PQQ-binding-like beta-propeller repeat protein [Alienimonas californiensis]QDT14545.1 outer membrane biogenesis protein BamB [Alienimonas californiensis]